MTAVGGPLVVAACTEFTSLILLRFVEERRRGLCAASRDRRDRVAHRPRVHRLGAHRDRRRRGDRDLVAAAAARLRHHRGAQRRGRAARARSSCCRRCSSGPTERNWVSRGLVPKEILEKADNERGPAPTLGTIPGRLPARSADPPAGQHPIPGPAPPLPVVSGAGPYTRPDGCAGFRAPARTTGRGRVHQGLPQRAAARRGRAPAAARDGRPPHARRARHRRPQRLHRRALHRGRRCASTTTPTCSRPSSRPRPASTPGPRATTSSGRCRSGWSRTPSSGAGDLEIESALKEGDGGRVGALVLTDGSRLPLTEAIFSIGRLPDCDLHDRRRPRLPAPRRDPARARRLPPGRPRFAQRHHGQRHQGEGARARPTATSIGIAAVAIRFEAS